MKKILIGSLGLLLSFSVVANRIAPDKIDQNGEPKNFRVVTDNNEILMKVIGSGEFTEKWLKQQRDMLPKPLVIVDLRQEPHGFVNGYPYTWYTKQNVENVGLPDALVEMKERLWLKRLKRQYKKVEVLSERKLVQDNGLTYLRFPIQDHHSPSVQTLKKWLADFSGQYSNKWLYFHCRAGVGRTTFLMAAIDIMKNRENDSFITILKRQASIGGKDYTAFYPVNTYKYPLMVERYHILKALYGDKDGPESTSKDLIS